MSSLFVDRRDVHLEFDAGALVFRDNGTNGERIAVKNEINRVAGSALVEEKQYQGE